MSESLLATAAEILERARRAGAGAAEVFARRTREHEVTVRRDRTERVHCAVARGLGLRLFMGTRQGLAHTTELDSKGLEALVDGALAAARSAAPDPEGALPEPEDLTGGDAAADLELFDPAIAALTEPERLALAAAAESAALAHPRVTHSEGSTFSDAVTDLILINSAGLEHSHSATRCSLVSKPVAAESSGAASGKQVQFWYSSARHLSDLEEPHAVGRRAAERAARMLGARPIPTGRATVVFDPIQAGRFWSGIFPALNGDAVHKGLSYLTGCLGETIASPEVTLLDDGRLPRGIASTPRDGEGVPARRKLVLERGILRSFLYDCRTARKARARTTGNASRAYSSPPSIGPHNFFLAAGPYTPEEIIRSTRRGLYVMQVIGFGVNATTGDYSRGANGIWIEGGELSHPVQEVVISGNLKQMLPAVSMVGRDLTLRSSFSSPTFKVEEMTISGI